jgi:signal transduction histidine kinase
MTIDIEDDGLGIDPAAPAGVGLRSMRERAAELNGTFVIGANPGGGTRVRVSLPLTDASGGA